MLRGDKMIRSDLPITKSCEAMEHKCGAIKANWANHRPGWLIILG